MLWLGIDFETTGLDAEKDQITEIGAVLWDTEAKEPIQIYNELLKIDGPVPEEITTITGITKGMLTDFGIEGVKGVSQLCSLIMEADYVIAHNAPFDKGFFEAALECYGLVSPECFWIDSSKDVPYPKSITTRKLVHLAAEHGFVNPFAHRAVFDVLTMLRVVSQYDVDTVINYAKSPSLTIRAMVTYQDRAQASSRGYRWNADKKWWLKHIKEFQLEEEKQEAPFEVTIIEGGLSDN